MASVPSTKARATSDSRRLRERSVVAQHDERLAHVEAEALGQLALGLLDDDPAVQRRLQLLVERVAAAQLRSCSRPMVATSASA